jgi:hypothetical protein
MNRCGTCKFWGGHKNPDAPYKHHPCERIKHDDMNDTSPPMDWKWGEGGKPDESADDAVVQDGSGFYAALKTRKSFGCVFHEPLEENDDKQME